VVGRGFFVVNLWWIAGESWEVDGQDSGSKNMPLLPDLFLRDSHFGNLVQPHPSLSENGYGKGTDVDQFRLQSRSGKGVINHGGRGIELLGDRYETDALLVELFHDLGEVGQGAGEAVNFINDDGVDSLRGNIVQEFLQPWPLHVAAGEAAIVVAGEDDMPSLMTLAEDLRLTGLSLGVEGIEGLLQSLFG
jgi:hypothetical protein